MAVWANVITIHHAASVAPTDESVIFSFVKSHPELNPRLLASSDTTTIFSRGDQLVGSGSNQPLLGVVLAANQTSTKLLASTASTIQEDVIVKTNPSDTQGISRNGLTTYKVQSGDTLTTIATSFGISPQTIMMENKLNETSTLKSGQELSILPTTGISHALTEGETMESIIKKYKVTEDDFLDANNIETFEDLAIGTIVVIPLQSVTMPAVPKPASKFVVDNSNKIALKEASAPDLGNNAVSFAWPTSTKSITQGYSSRHSGLDISDSKKEPIYASAAGFVEVSGFQSNGYGNTIIINHGSGFKTRYAHASELTVQAGDYVEKGQQIGKQGNTGRVRGITGIHLHFEIIQNGKKVNPLKYVKP